MPQPLNTQPAQPLRRLAALLALGLLCSACSPKQAEPETQGTISSSQATSNSQATAAPDATTSAPAATLAANPLLHSRWQLTQLRGEAVASGNPEQAAHIVFGPANRIAGSDGCNRLMGSYSLEGGQLNLGQLVSTRMACLDSTAPAEEFTRALGEVASYRLEEEELELLGAEGDSLARFTRNEQQP